MLYKIGLKFLRNQFWLYITWKNEQKILLWHFGICPGQCTSDRREYELSLCLIKEVGFRKNSLTKVMEILNNFYAKNSFSALCKKYQYDISVFWLFPSFLVSSYKSNSNENHLRVSMLCKYSVIFLWWHSFLKQNQTQDQKWRKMSKYWNVILIFFAQCTLHIPLKHILTQ